MFFSSTVERLIIKASFSKKLMTSEPSSTIDNFVAAVRGDLYLDSSRMDFVRQNARLLQQLSMGGLVGRNRFRRLLLGAKSTGKTCLLQSMLRAVSPHFLNVRAFYTSMLELIHHPLTPFQLIAKHLSIPCETENGIHTYLVAHQTYVFFVIDELHLLYTHAFKRRFALRFLQELYAVGDSVSGLMHAVICG